MIATVIVGISCGLLVFFIEEKRRPKEYQETIRISLNNLDAARTILKIAKEHLDEARDILTKSQELDKKATDKLHSSKGYLDSAVDILKEAKIINKEKSHG